MKVHLVSFADRRFHKAKKRFSMQAEKFGLFDSIQIFDEVSISAEFKAQFSSIFHRGTRGFGYWVWKPEIIMKTLEKINDGDILIYLDVGFHINTMGRKRFLEYLRILKASSEGVLVFKYDNSIENSLVFKPQDVDWTLEAYTKAYTANKLAGSEWSKLRHRKTSAAGILIIQKRLSSIKFIKHWRDLTYEDVHLFDDALTETEHHKFIAHRHDQSVFSILSELSDVQFMSAFEHWGVEPARKRVNWSKYNNMPFWAARDLGQFKKKILIALSSKGLFR